MKTYLMQDDNDGAISKNSTRGMWKYRDIASGRNLREEVEEWSHQKKESIIYSLREICFDNGFDFTQIERKE